MEARGGEKLPALVFAQHSRFVHERAAATTWIWIPTYRDIHGRPMLRMTFDFTENDHKMSDYLTDRAAEVAKAMNPREIKLNRRTGSWSVVPYQTTHNTGGAIMGDNPRNSVVNKYLQTWDVPNVFSMGSGRVPAKRRLQPDRHGCGARLHVGGCHQVAVPEGPGPAGAGGSHAPFHRFAYYRWSALPLRRLGVGSLAVSQNAGVARACRVPRSRAEPV